MNRARGQLMVMLCLILIGSTVVLYEMLTTDQERLSALQERLSSVADTEFMVMAHEYDRYQDQLVLLSDWIGQLGATYATTPNPAGAPSLQGDSDFLGAVEFAMLQTIQRIAVMDHVRLMDERGTEVARVQRARDGKISVVPRDELQSKWHRPYVQAFAALAPGVVGATRISLNEEQGEVEVPHRPMVRLGIRQRIGDQHFLLVINYAADGVLAGGDGLRDAELFWVNSAGYFIAGGDRFQDWVFGWQLDQPERTFEAALPVLADVIASKVSAGQNAGHFEDHLGRYYWMRSPLAAKNIMVPSELRSGTLVIFQPYALALTDIRLFGLNAWPYWLLLVVIFVLLVAASLWVYWQDVSLVTAREEAESRGQALRSAYHRLREEEGRRADLLSVVGHEIRSPIASMAMLADSPQADWHAAQSTFRRLLRTALGLLDDLKMVANPADTSTSGEVLEINLKTVLQDSLATVSALISASKIKVTLDPGSDPGACILVNVTRLQAVISNLLRNAALHSGGSHLWLQAEFLDKPDLLAALPVLRGEGGRQIEAGDQRLLRVTVEDDGVGIPLEDRARLFQIFERGSSGAPGMGIGLHVVRQWLDEIGGRVEYMESPRGGAGFEILIRVGKSNRRSFDPISSAESPIAPEAEGEQPLAGKTILLAEDDALLRKMTTRLLEEYGARVITANDGEEALQIIKNRAPDLLLTDNFMPQLSGVDLLRALYDQGLSLPAVAITAATIGRETDDLLAVGALEVIAKPLRRTDIAKLAGFLSGT